VCNVPYDPLLKAHAVFDLGWNDSTAIIIAQRHLSEVRVIEYIEDDHRTLDWYSAELRNKHYNWGKLFLPHDGQHGNMQTGQSSADILRKLKWSVSIVPNQPIETGIKQARMAFPRVYFDKAGSQRLIQCLKRYKRTIPVATGEPASPVHDEFSHGADCFRYLSLIASSMRNESDKPIQYPELGLI
jgi:phage terminase large subunit